MDNSQDAPESLVKRTDGVSEGVTSNDTQDIKETVRTAHSGSDEIAPNADNDKRFEWTGKRLAVAFTGAVIAPALLAIGVSFVAIPAIEGNHARDSLSQVANARGPVTAGNTELTVFTGQRIEATNVEQKALTGHGAEADVGRFVFTNGKPSDHRKVLEVFIDFSSQNSRDFILLNQSVLKSLIEFGNIDLHIRPLPSGRAFSVYAPEALAESFVTSPDRSWDFMVELMKLSATLKTNKPEEILESIEETAGEAGVSDIDSQSVSNGTFAGWLLAAGNDQKLKTGYYPPIAYLNGVEIDPNVVDLNDSTALQRYILSEGE